MAPSADRKKTRSSRPRLARKVINRRPVKKRAIISMAAQKSMVAQQEPIRLRPFLEQLLNEGQLKCLRWEKKEEKIFSISWIHASNSGYDQEQDGILFKLWDERQPDSQRHSDAQKQKANFRSALNSLPDLLQLTKDEEKRGKEARRTFQFLDHDDKRCQDKIKKRKAATARPRQNSPRKRRNSLKTTGSRSSSPRRRRNVRTSSAETEEASCCWSESSTSFSPPPPLELFTGSPLDTSQKAGPSMTSVNPRNVATPTTSSNDDPRSTTPHCDLTYRKFQVETTPDGKPRLVILYERMPSSSSQTDDLLLKKTESNEGSSLPNFKKLGQDEQLIKMTEKHTSGGVVTICQPTPPVDEPKIPLLSVNDFLQTANMDQNRLYVQQQSQQNELQHEEQRYNYETHQSPFFCDDNVSFLEEIEPVDSDVTCPEQRAREDFTQLQAVEMPLELDLYVANNETVTVSSFDEGNTYNVFTPKEEPEQQGNQPVTYQDVVDQDLLLALQQAVCNTANQEEPVDDIFNIDAA